MSVISNFSISGSFQTILFEKYVTTKLPTYKLIVSNSSDTSGITFFPTASQNSRIIFTSDGSSTITKANPITLLPKTGSNTSAIEIYADVNIAGLNNAPDEDLVDGNQLVEDIYFNLVSLDKTIGIVGPPLPGYSIDAKIFDVNMSSSVWINNAFGRKSDALGLGNIPFSPSDPRYPLVVRFTENVLLEKKQKLLKFREVLGKKLLLNGGQYFRGDSYRASFRRGFAIIYYGILFNSFPKLNFNDVDNKTELSSYFDIAKLLRDWGIPTADAYKSEFFDFGQLGNFNLWDNYDATHLPSGAAFMIINKTIFLINKILQTTTGLSTLLPPTTGSVLAPTESSRIDYKVGTFDIDVYTPKISLTDAIFSSSKELIQRKTTQFFDENREYKTILNFSVDQQYVIESWRPVSNDSSSVQFKLLTPLNSIVDLDSLAYVARDFAKPVIDKILIDPPPFVDTTPYLRPLNMKVGKFNTNTQTIRNATINSLGLYTGSYGQITGSVISYEDRIFNRWYTADFKASELNIDFSNYANFVMFGSAKARLDAFRQKLLKVQQINPSASISSSIEGEKIKAVERQLIIRNFDAYEQYLYFSTDNTPYSASAFYIDGGIEYNSTGSWPKDSLGKPLSFDAVQPWYNTQSEIAERYDQFNPNYLIKHLPEHIQEDAESEDFLQFIDLFGHMMDNIKVYVDQFPYMYSTNPNPLKELSMDQVYEVSKAFGMNLPNAYSLESLESFVESVYGSESNARTLIAETWKRFLHNLPFLYKTKGTKTSLDAVLNIFGINTPAVQIKESSYPTDTDYLASDEYSYALSFTSASANVITIPFISSSVTASSLQIRFNPTLKKTSTLLSGDTSWAIDLKTHPSASIVYNKIIYVSGSPTFISQNNKMGDYGRLELVSGSGRTVIATSSFFPLFSDDYTHVMFSSQSGDMSIIQTDGDQLLFQEVVGINWGSLWNNTRKIYVGGTGSIRISPFDGVIDEIHVWSERITNDNFINQAYDPGSYYGNTYTSSYSSLPVHLGFSQVQPSVTQSIANETPYVSASNVETIRAVGFTTESYEKVLRGIKQFVPTVGAMAYSNSQVKVAPPPVFGQQFVDEDGSYLLSRTNSIKLIEDKKYTGGMDILWFAVSPTEFINQTIMRSMGVVDVNYLIGSPRKFRNERYNEVEELLEFYLEHYNKSVNANQYIRFYKNLLKAPTDYVRENVPARTNLLDGIILESPILYRKRVVTQKAFRVDGANTVTFEKFVTGSGSANVGAYQFDADYELYTSKDTTVITKPVMQYINGREGQQSSLVTSSVVNRNSSVATIPSFIEITESTHPVSSTAIEKIPQHRNFLQNITTNKDTASFVISSLTDEGSGISYVDSVLDSQKRENEIYSGYNRNPYMGLLTGSIYRVSSEVGTAVPFYSIEPLSNFNDVGTTTYFYNKTGIHWFSSRLVNKNIRIATKRGIPLNIEPKYDINNKRLYRAKFDSKIKGEVESDISDLYTNITLLNPDELSDYPNREATVIKSRTYSPGVPYFGVLKIANIFSLFNIDGVPGLRIRLYSSQKVQGEDESRPFNVIPSSVNSGVLFDAILTENENLVYPYTLVQTNNSTIYFTINNTTGTDITSNISLYYYEYEPTSLIPIGYLPRHYKFNRLEVVAQRRRNYLGCKLVYCPEGCSDNVLNKKTYVGKNKNTIQTTIEGESPVQIFLSTRTSAVVNRSSGGGTGPAGATAGQAPVSPGAQSPVDQILNIGGRGKLSDKKK